MEEKVMDSQKSNPNNIKSEEILPNQDPTIPEKKDEQVHSHSVQEEPSNIQKDHSEHDHSKPANIFQSPRNHQSDHQVTKPKKRSKDDDVLDFSQIKKSVTNFFKGIGSIFGKTNNSKTENTHNPLDSLSLTIAFFQKHKKWLIPFFCIFLAIVISTHFRMMPSDLPITDTWAENTVHTFYQNQVSSQINEQYPNLPDQNKNALVQQEFASFLKTNKGQVQAEIAQISQQYKANFQDERGDTYLLAIDPYLWYSEARNYIEYGHLGDTLIDGESYFSLRDGRLDKEVSVQLNPVFGAYLYKFLHIFNPNISIMRGLFLLPVVLIGLAIIPTFFIARRFAGNVGGFFAAVFLAVNSALLGRTPAGFADTDAYNVLIPLFVTWLFFEAYSSNKTLNQILFSIGAAFFVGLYSATWGGWSYIFLFVLVALISTAFFILIQDLFRHKFSIKSILRIQRKLYKKIGIVFVSFLIGSALFVSWFQSFSTFWSSFSRPVRFIYLKEVGVKSIWPNVLTTVAEFNTTSFSNITSKMGGNLLFFIALIGLAFLLFVAHKDSDKKLYKNWNRGYIFGAAIYYMFLFSIKDNLNNVITFIIVMSLPLVFGFIKTVYLKERKEILYPIYLTIWMLGSAYAFSKGIRFALLLTSPFVVLLGIGIGILYTKGTKGLTSAIKLDPRISGLLVFLILSLLLITPLSQAQSIAQNEVPSMNDAWHGTLMKISNAAPDSIITSWWDFGHWFVAIAQRRVTFDGGDQGERIHWVGKSLLTASEKEAIGTLRMLNCAQETAPHKLDEFTKNSLVSVHIINEVLLESTRAGAQRVYENNGLTPTQAQEMLEYTHCADLLPNYYITSEDMVGKAGVWGHFGSWDFDRATMYQGTNKLSRADAVTYLTEEFILSVDEADKIHQEIQTTKGDQWISPWPGYISGITSCRKISPSELSCPISIRQGTFDFRVDLPTFDVVIANSDNATPDSVVYGLENQVITRDLGGTTGLSIVLIPDGEEYKALLADPLLVGSMFTRLFFFDGLGLECFKKFDDVQQITGGRIVTWEVDYSCSS